MRDLEQVRAAADIDIYFSDPHAPWQRPSNENTNGLLRQYLPKGSDLSIHTETDLDAIAAELNDRPRKRLDFAKPIEKIEPLLLRSPLEPKNPSSGMLLGVYEVTDGVPNADDYVHLRSAVNLSSGSAAAAARGLAATWAAAIATTAAGETVAMGRLVGDGSLFLQVVDMVTLPEHQRQGLGGRVLNRLLTRARHDAPEAFVSLIADPAGQDLYRRHDFLDVEPSLGMEWLGSRGARIHRSTIW
jgi:GNAT superfamily N-acetyltransferase